MKDERNEHGKPFPHIGRNAQFRPDRVVPVRRHCRLLGPAAEGLEGINKAYPLQVLELPPQSLRSEFRAQNLATVSKVIEIVRPPLHHLHALVPIFTSGISPPHLVGVDMRELSFDCVRVPFAHLVEERSGHRPETMRGHLVRGVAKTA